MQRAGVDRRPRPAGRGSVLGVSRGQPHPAATAPCPGGRRRPGTLTCAAATPRAQFGPLETRPGFSLGLRYLGGVGVPSGPISGGIPHSRPMGASRRNAPEGSLRRTSASPSPGAQWSDLTWSKWRRAEPLRSCAGGRTGDRAGAGGKSQMTGFGGLCAGILESALFGRSARGLRGAPSPASLPERLILQSGP